MSIIANMIDGQLAFAKEQYESLLEARSKPYVLNDEIIERVLKVFTEQLEFTFLYDKQLSKWKNEEKLTQNQETEIYRLQGQMKIFANTIKDILALADKLKIGTIEKVMEKSDLELGLEFFKNNF